MHWGQTQYGYHLLTSNRSPWYDCSESFNPAIHRMREAIYHLAVTPDLNSNPVPPPHPSLLKYLSPPLQNIETSSGTVQQLIKALDIKAAPPPKKKFERKPGGTDAREEYVYVYLNLLPPLTSACTFCLQLGY